MDNVMQWFSSNPAAALGYILAAISLVAAVGALNKWNKLVGMYSATQSYGGTWMRPQWMSIKGVASFRHMGEIGASEQYFCFRAPLLPTLQIPWHEIKNARTQGDKLLFEVDQFTFELPKDPLPSLMLSRLGL